MNLRKHLTLKFYKNQNFQFLKLRGKNQLGIAFKMFSDLDFLKCLELFKSIWNMKAGPSTDVVRLEVKFQKGALPKPLNAEVVRARAFLFFLRVAI